MSDEPHIFPNLLTVARHLKAQGWRISKSSVYEHAKSGKLSPDEAGNYTLEEIEAYARRWLKRADQPSDHDAEDLQQKKLRAEAKRIRAQAEREELKLQHERGSYIRRAEYEQALAVRAQLFKTDLENFARSSVGEIINLVDGDAGKGPDLQAWLLGEIEEFLGRYSREAEFAV